jgi:hypothetical protein
MTVLARTNINLLDWLIVRPELGKYISLTPLFLLCRYKYCDGLISRVKNCSKCLRFAVSNVWTWTRQRFWQSKKNVYSTLNDIKKALSFLTKHGFSEWCITASSEPLAYRFLAHSCVPAAFLSTLKSRLTDESDISIICNLHTTLHTGR